MLNKLYLFLIGSFYSIVRSNMKNMLLYMLAFSGSCQAGSLTKIRENALRIPEAMSCVKLLHNQDRFLVSDDEGLHEIDNCWLDADLRALARNPIALDKFQQFGYISVDKTSDGQYFLRKHVRGKGGGPVLAAIFGGATYAICYGTAIAGITFAAVPAVAASPLLAGPAAAVVAGAIPGGAAAAGVSTTLLTLGGGPVALAASQAALAAGGAAASTAGTTGILAGVMAVNTAIGGLATTMSAIGMAIPFF